MKRLQDISRSLFSIILLSGGIANTIIVLTNPDLYSGFADLSLLPLYQQLWVNLIIPNLQFMIGLVVMLEWLIAVLLLGKRFAVKLGAFLGGVFMVLLTPFWWSGGGAINLAFALILFWLTTSEYPSSVLELLNGVE